MSQVLTPQHEDNSEPKSHKREEGRHAENPADIHGRLPLIDEERDCNPKNCPVEIHNGGRLDRVSGEALDLVIDNDRDVDVGREDDEEESNRCDHVLEMVLDSSPEEAETDGESDQAREPQRVETMLGLPNSARPPAHPKRDSVIKVVPEHLATDNTHPGGETDCSHVR